MLACLWSAVNILYKWDILTICDAVVGVGLGAVDRM